MKRKRKFASVQPPFRRGAKRERIACAILLSSVFTLASCNQGAPPPQPAAQAHHTPSPTATQKIPPFHPSAEAAKPFPKTLPPEKFETPYVAAAYRIAQQIPGVLAQQPCYCFCDAYGHGSLLDCYQTDHGAG
jgi:hypothetical protein